MSGVRVKICGISEPAGLTAAIEAGARYVGFVFYPPSSRYVAIDTAKELALQVPTGVRAVGLFVDPTDLQLQETLGKVQLDMIQLHGMETPDRVAEIKARYAMPVMKAIRVREASDLEEISAFEAVADWLLFDSKPEQASLPGGTGHKFDWDLLKGREFNKPWMLAGGVTVDNVADALSQLTPNAIDISSGVEHAPGVKDAEKIKAFMTRVKML